VTAAAGAAAASSPPAAAFSSAAAGPSPPGARPFLRRIAAAAAAAAFCALSCSCWCFSASEPSLRKAGVKNFGSLLLPPAAEALAADSFCFSYGKDFLFLVNRYLLSIWRDG
jgi:hypothetical protein